MSFAAGTLDEHLMGVRRKAEHETRDGEATLDVLACVARYNETSAWKTFPWGG